MKIDESVIENCRFDFEGSDGGCREIFQWFLTNLNEGDVEWLEESFGLLFSYSEKLGLYILCVDHLGTHWDSVDCPCYNDGISDELLKRTSKDFLMTYELTKENHDEIADKILFEIADFVKKVERFGYMVQTPYWYSDVLALELIPSSANKYLPIIKLAPFHKEKTGTKYCTCTLQITSFGFYLRDFKEFLKACKQAAKLVKYLETVDFSTFPTVI